ncbi:MAG TPA: outer membrane lipoprotein carrier protein LolA [Candidatus Methanoperedens sp.]|nr:outer membrane lipoprotein carrier protein LolA [Candidatus Methanoperedens sp.]
MRAQLPRPAHPGSGGASRRLAGVAFLLSLLAAATPSGAATTDEVLARLARGAAAVETLQARIVQEKRLEMFQDTVTSRGRFAYRRPDRLRWELTEPVATGFVVAGSSGRRWHGLTGRTEPFELERDPMMKVVAGQLLGWARADFGAMQREFRIAVASEAPITLQLEPLAAGAFVARVTMVFSKSGDHVESVTVEEKGGDRTVMRFTDVEVNQPLPDGLF